jgi:hypothetical protein
MLPIPAQEMLSSWLQAQHVQGSESPINVEELYTMFERVMDPNFYGENKSSMIFGGGGSGGYGGTTKCCATGTCDNGPRFPG